MVNDIKLYSKLPEISKTISDLPTNSEGYLKLSYFKD